MGAFIFYGASASANLECAYGIACKILQNEQHVKSDSFPDFLHITPQDSIISIEQTKILTDFFSTKAEFGKAKIAIIETAENMTINSANSILKTVEELNDNYFVFLTTTRLFFLLPTIRSRCQKYYINCQQEYLFTNDENLCKSFAQFLIKKDIATFVKNINAENFNIFTELLEHCLFQNCLKTQTNESATLYIDAMKIITKLKSPDPQIATAALCSLL